MKLRRLNSKTPAELIGQIKSAAESVRSGLMLPLLRQSLSSVHPELSELNISLKRRHRSFDLQIVVGPSQLDFSRILLVRVEGIRSYLPLLGRLEVYSREEYSIASSLIRDLGETAVFLEEIRSRIQEQKLREAGESGPVEKIMDLLPRRPRAILSEKWQRPRVEDFYQNLSREVAAWVQAQFTQELAWVREQSWDSDGEVQVLSQYLGTRLRLGDGFRAAALSIPFEEGVLLAALLPDPVPEDSPVSELRQLIWRELPRLSRLRRNLVESEAVLAVARSRGFQGSGSTELKQWAKTLRGELEGKTF